MKIISKITIIAVFAAFFAQSSFAQASFGIRGGANFANMNLSANGDDTKSIIGYQFGVALEAPISGAVGLRAGLEVQSKGFKQDITGVGFTSKSTLTPIYLQVPVVVAYNGAKFFIGAGPYAGYGIAGKVKYTATGTGISIDKTDDIKYGSSENDTFMPLDFGARFEAGLKLNQVRIGLNCDLGLANAIAKDNRDGESAKHSVIGLFAAFMF